MSINYYLKLRNNIKLQGDIDLARQEIEQFFDIVETIDECECISFPKEIITRNARSGVTGFLATHNKVPQNELPLLLNFVQEIWCDDIEENELQSKPYVSFIDVQSKRFFCIVPFMAAGELLSKFKKEVLTEKTLKQLVNFLADKQHRIPSKEFVFPKGNTSTPHIHALHKYKAKFFPRLIRFLLIKYSSVVPKGKEGKITFLDPFVGSGTSLVETSLLNMQSYGIDIDLLSCEISDAKVKAHNIDIDVLQKELSSLPFEILEDENIECSYTFPNAIAKKFERWDRVDEQKKFEKNIQQWINIASSIQDKKVKQLVRICISDGLSKKFSIRMMGTGVGRFALEIAKTPLDTIIKKNIKNMLKDVSVLHTLISSYGISPENTKIIHGTALSLPYEDKSFSMILTSPPYLPASSGREDYLIGKSISNTALGLMSIQEIENTEQSAVGSMSINNIEDIDDLPESVIHLYKWLLTDELRKIKAVPVLHYYKSLKKALEESYRVLMKDGLAIYVIGKESVFYSFKSREVLYKVQCDNIFEEIAIDVGFEIVHKYDIELDKRNKNARPRSLDAYFETVYVLKKI